MRSSGVVVLFVSVLISVLLCNGVHAQDTEQMLEKARNLSISGNDKMALEVYREIIAIDPDNAQAYNHIGTLYYNEAVENRDIKLLRMAMEKFKKALNINSSYGEAHDNLAMCYIITREDDKAWVHYQKAKGLGIRNERLEARFFGN